MALIFKDRVKETTTTTGTGTVNLDGAETGFQSFVAAIGTTNTCHYAITDGTSWEVGLGTVTDAAPDTLSRDTVYDSSNAGSLVNFTAGTKDVFCAASSKEIRDADTHMSDSTLHRIINDNGTSTTELFSASKIDSDFLKLAGGTLSGNLLQGDQDYHYWGASNDFSIRHNGTNTELLNNTGSLFIVNQVNSGTFNLNTFNSSGVEKLGVSISGATPSVKLHYGGIQSASTSNLGGSLYGLNFGSSGSGSIHHDSSTLMYIRNAAGNMLFRDDVDSGLITLDTLDSGGALKTGVIIGGATPNVSLYYDGVQVASTESGGLNVGSLTSGSPTGGNKGAGTINATAVYDDNVLLTCYVFDQAVDNKINLAKWDAKVVDRVIPEVLEVLEERDKNGNIKVDGVAPVPKKIIIRSHEPAKKFKSRIGSQYDPLDIDKYSQHWKDKKHLTSMPNEVTYDPENTTMSSGSWIQRLVETVEIQAVHIETLNQRLKKLETKPLK